MDWKPLYDKIVVRRDAPDEKLSAQVVAAEAYQKRKHRGVVEAVGEGRICIDGSILALTVKVGDRVLFGQHAGVDLEEEGKDLVMLREDELLAFCREK